MTDRNKIESKLAALAHVASIAKMAGDDESAHAIADAMLTLMCMTDVLARAAKHIGKDDWLSIVSASEADATAAFDEVIGDRSNVIDFPGPKTVN